MRRTSLLASAAALSAFAALPSAADAEDLIRRRKDGKPSGKAADDPDDDADASLELAKAIKGLGDDLAKRDAEIDKVLAKANDEVEKTGQMAAETKAELAKLVEKATDMQSRLADLEQKATRQANDRGGQVKSLGQRFAESDEVATALERGQAWKGRASMGLKAITSATNDANGSAGDLLVPHRLAGIVAPEDRTMTIRNLIMPGRTSGSSIEYVKETGFTNAAAMVAEGAAKPESSLKFDLETAQVRTLAHWVLASKQILDDVPQLESYIDGRLRFGLAIVEENQLLLGDGMGQNILGIMPQATDFDDARRQAGDTKIDTLRRAMTQVRISELRATGIVMHPSDWEDIELTKTDDNAYVFANPQNSAQPRLWGLPVVDTTAMPEGEFLVGAFRMGAQVFDREQANVEISTEDSDNFRKNLVTIRAEERLALVVSRPEAFVAGPFEEA